jgi:hypothetical protein
MYQALSENESINSFFPLLLLTTGIYISLIKLFSFYTTAVK